MNRVRLFSYAILLVLLSGIFVSCAVFETVGGAFSQLYDNSVSYFNVYYNAQRIFEEAEAVVLANQQDAKAKAVLTQKPSSPPAIPKDKFTSVIDKCSSILSFYPKSAVADDAVLLIGKSYFYQGEYLKAERKFSELLSQYPGSSLVLEGQLWFAKTLERLKKNDDAVTIAEQVAHDALEQQETDIAHDAYQLLALIAEQEGNIEQAITLYTKALETATDGYIIAELHAKMGDLYAANKKYEQANSEYLQVYEDGVPNIALDFYARLQAIRGYTELKKFDTAIFFSEEMLDNYRFAMYHQLIRLEYAKVLLLSGYTDAALDEYVAMDTSYARTENGALASFRLAEYYEKKEGNLSRAATYYAKAGSVPTAQFTLTAKKKENALLRIVSLRKDLVRNDSLIALSDSARRYPHHFLQPAPIDTASVLSDSSLTTPSEPKLVETFKPLNPDSLKTLSARVAYDLGEIYYTEFEQSDSAFTWFQRAWDWCIDSTRAPRTLFILAELKKSLLNASDAEIASLYRQILEEYSWSNYAREVGRLLGLQTAQQANVTLDRQYAVAESLLWVGNYELAIESLKRIALENPGSPYAAKSQYALGWAYENKLSKPDSALFYYQLISEQYQSSPYAAAVRNKLPSQEQGQKADQPSKINQPPQDAEGRITTPGKNITPGTKDDTPLNRRLPPGRNTAADSLKVRDK